MSYLRITALPAAAVLVALITGGPATAAPAPLADPSSDGYLGFCDDEGRQIRSGDLGAAPFAPVAVSSVAAPSGYEKGFAVLTVYQPRPGVDPIDWSGKQLTAASAYSNPAHPMAAGTGADPALVDFTSVFPPKVDGLVQLRLSFSAPDRPQHSTPYPSVFVRVADRTWTQVGGGDVPCDAGKVVSAETVRLPASALSGTRSTPGAPPPDQFLGVVVGEGLLGRGGRWRLRPADRHGGGRCRRRRCRGDVRTPATAPLGLSDGVLRLFIPRSRGDRALVVSAADRQGVISAVRGYGGAFVP